jgi:Phage integrase family
VKLFEKEDSKYWWYDFTVRGERFRGSTKETNESRARKIAALKFAEACENSDPLPRKAPTLRQVSKRFLDWVDSARIEINGVREVPLSDRVLTLLRARCASRKEGWVFPSKRSASGRLTTMARRFREARTKAGLPKGLVLNCGRHDFGTRVLKKTGNLKLVMQTMGHVDVKTAMKYQHPELDIVRSALNETEPDVPQAGA